MPLPKLFVSTLFVAIFALALVPVAKPVAVALAANLLAVGAAIVLTWREAAKGALGTHMSPDSTVVTASDESLDVARDGEKGS